MVRVSSDMYEMWPEVNQNKRFAYIKVSFNLVPLYASVSVRYDYKLVYKSVFIRGDKN